MLILINFPLVLIFMGSISHCWKDVVTAPDPPTGREGWGHCSTGTEGLVEVLMWTGSRDSRFFFATGMLEKLNKLPEFTSDVLSCTEVSLHNIFLDSTIFEKL